MIERVGLNPTLIAKSRVRATQMATQRTGRPVNFPIAPRNGKARTITPARIPPRMMNGRRRPPQNHTLSLIRPTSGWARTPASGPASQTYPTSWMARWYCVLRIQLNAEIWMHRAKPIAVAGRLRRT